jgi:hypothetical protein
MPEYTLENTTYEEVRFKTLQAFLESQFGIEVNDFGGMLQVKKDGKLIGIIEISEDNPHPKKDKPQ